MFSSKWEVEDDERAIVMREVEVEKVKAEDFEAGVELYEKAFAAYVVPLLEGTALYRLKDNEAFEYRLRSLEVEQDRLVITAKRR